MLVPEFYATVEVRTALNRDQVAAGISGALGVIFEEDFEGHYEEANALVAEVFKIAMGVYGEVSESSDPTTHRILVDLWDGFDNLDLEQREFVRLFISDFLAALLRSRTGLPFKALPPIVMSEEGIRETRMVPSLQATLEIETTKSLAQVAARVGAALGISFGRTKCVGERRPYAGWWYAREAHALEHQVILYAENGPYSTPLPRRMVLELQPMLNLADLGLDESQWEVVDLPIAEYLTAILRKETDLPFRPLPPVPPSSQEGQAVL